MFLLQSGSFQALLPVVRQRIIDGFTTKALNLFHREFDFFDKVTSISGVLYPLSKEERRAGIRRYTPNLNAYAHSAYGLYLAVNVGMWLAKIESWRKLNWREKIFTYQLLLASLLGASGWTVEYLYNLQRKFPSW